MAALELWPLGVHIDQAHGMACLHPEIRLREVAAEVVRLVLFRPPEVLRAREVRLTFTCPARVDPFHSELHGPPPVRVVDAAKAKLFGGAAAGLDANCARESDQIAPGDLILELVLNLTKQAAGLVQVHVVAPLVLGPMALTRALAPPNCLVCAIHQPERPGAMPSQATKQTRVAGDVAVLWAVRGPAILRVCHQTSDRVIEVLDVQSPQLLVVLRLAQNGFAT
mmetsp:Transcript_106504/g.266936  ORF Transcript_106504/g.266936 Transcript_106504/m.266936 type:complete len:224 (-) Transcript_106504:263-934(-)